MGKTLLKISVVYFMLGISFGLYMSLTHIFTLTSVHIHINLLGWMSLALIGVFYHILSEFGEEWFGEMAFLAS